MLKQSSAGIVVYRVSEDGARTYLLLQYPGKYWDFPKGKPEGHEKWMEAAVRETKEETSIIVKKAKIICVNTDKNEYAHYVTVGLIAEEFEGSPKDMEPDEISGWQWIELDKLPQKMFIPAKKIIDCYLQNKITLD